VIRGGAIGDFILTLPAIKALRDSFPNAHIEILGYKQIAALAENRFYAERVRSIESAELAPFFAKNAALPSDLARHFAGFDLILSYLYDPNWIFEGNLRRSGAQKIVQGPSKIEEHSPAALQLTQPVKELGLPISDLTPRVYPSREDRNRAGQFLDQLAEPIVAFHPGSGSEKKNWPVQNWIEIGNHFLSNSIGSLLVILGEADEGLAGQLELNWQDSRVRFAKTLPLTDLAAVLEDAIFLGHDSGISHLAAAAGAKSIMLFGPTNPEIWAPPNENVRVIRAPKRDLGRLDIAVVRDALDQALAHFFPCF